MLSLLQRSHPLQNNTRSKQGKQRKEKTKLAKSQESVGWPTLIVFKLISDAKSTARVFSKIDFRWRDLGLPDLPV